MIRIILTDYHQIIREGLKLILKDASDFIVVAEAQTGIQVSQKIQNTACDILLLDMDIPGNNSVELLYDLKKIKPT
ncbi:MAG TPA: response regulator, partial [Candidatus Paceibacterota bacterium]